MLYVIVTENRNGNVSISQEDTSEDFEGTRGLIEKAGYEFVDSSTIRSLAGDAEVKTYLFRQR